MTGPTRFFATAAFFLAVVATPCFSHALASRQQISGDWDGKINTGKTTLEVLLHVAHSPSGKLVATLDSVTQGESDIEVENLALDGDRIHFEIEGGSGVYDGSISDSGITGEFKEGGATFPLNFARVSDKYVREVTPKKLRVAFVVSNNFNMIDFAGPWEVFQDAMDHSAGNMRGLMSVYTVSAAKTPIRSTGGATLVPRYTFDDAPQPDIVVVGAQSDASPKVLDWLRAQNKAGTTIMSVCTGAQKLAASGLLDGHAATSHHEFIETFKQRYPQVHWQTSRRYVQSSDNIFTAAGLTSGIDLALHVVASRFGQKIAQDTADYMEYHGTDWKQVQ